MSVWWRWMAESRVLLALCRMKQRASFQKVFGPAASKVRAGFSSAPLAALGMRVFRSPSLGMPRCLPACR